MKTVFQMNGNEWAVFGPVLGGYELHIRRDGRWAWFAEGFNSMSAAMNRAENASYVAAGK